jgi:predicted RNA-binding protein associated with RNAse of E/G family
VWQTHAIVVEGVSGRWFTVGRLYREDGALRAWYVNFERPPVWRAGGWDTFDLMVDLVVEPDGRWHWKDEDEYAHARRLGLIGEEEHRAVEAARGQALALVQDGGGLFGPDAAGPWRPEPGWPLPALPAGTA